MGHPAPASRGDQSAPGRQQSERTDVITSRNNKWLKLFRATLQGTGPRSGEPIGLEGPKMITDALRAGLDAEALLVSESGEAAASEVLRAASECEAGIPAGRILRTTDKLFDSIAGTETPQGVGAIFKQRDWTLEDVLRGPGPMRVGEPLVIVVAGVQDPGNVGTIVRSAEAFSATGVVATRGTADPWSPKALRASAGSGLRLPVLRGMAIAILMAQLRIAGVRMYAAVSESVATASTSSAISPEPDWRGPVAIFIGSEGSGLPSEVMNSVDGVISIPISGAVESLNAGIAASILLYEAARQRTIASREGTV